MWYELMSAHAIQSLYQCYWNDYSWMTKIYVSVNAFRSLFPVKVVERECLTNISSPLIDRALATVAELCFVKQLEPIVKEDYLLFYGILAQVCCWMGMFSQNNLYHVYEEYLWLLIGYHCFWKAESVYLRDAAFFYCIYMIVVDIPMYAFRYIQQDMVDLYNIQECTPIYELSTLEMIWRTGYFVGASRVSMWI